VFTRQQIFLLTWKQVWTGVFHCLQQVAYDETMYSF